MTELVQVLLGIGVFAAAVGIMLMQRQITRLQERVADLEIRRAAREAAEYATRMRVAQ